MRKRYVVVKHGDNWRVWDCDQHRFIGVFGSREEKIAEAKNMENA